MPAPNGSWSGIAAHFKSRIIRGFLILLPIAIIFAGVNFLIGTVDSLLAPILKFIPFIDNASLKFPGVGFILALLVSYLLGAIYAYTHGERIIEWVQRPLEKFPVYRTLKEVVELLLGRKKGSKGLRVVLLMDYPNDGYKVFGLVMSEQMIDDVLHYSVFIPTPPMINSGPVITVPASRVSVPFISDTDSPEGFQLMSVEKCALKFYLTNGTVAPRYIKTFKANDS